MPLCSPLIFLCIGIWWFDFLTFSKRAAFSASDNAAHFSEGNLRSKTRWSFLCICCQAFERFSFEHRALFVRKLNSASMLWNVSQPERWSGKMAAIASRAANKPPIFSVFIRFIYSIPHVRFFIGRAAAIARHSVVCSVKWQRVWRSDHDRTLVRSDHPDTEQASAKVGVFSKRATRVRFWLAESVQHGRDWHGVATCDWL